MSQSFHLELVAASHMPPPPKLPAGPRVLTSATSSPRITAAIRQDRAAIRTPVIAKAVSLYAAPRFDMVDQLLASPRAVRRNVV